MKTPWKPLPLLSFAARLVPTVDLQDTVLIGCQHLLSSTVDLCGSLIEQRGLRAKNVFLLGKCYSTNRRVVRVLERNGIYVSPLSWAYKSGVSFDKQHKDYVHKFLLHVRRAIHGKNVRHVVLLDDGGQLISMGKFLGLSSGKIFGVEQTTSGYERLRKQRLGFPVVNVARSRTKLQFESPVVASLVQAKLRMLLKKYRIKKPNILIVGKGAIGGSLHTALGKQHVVHAHDIRTHGHAFPHGFRKELGAFDIIIGATGTEILGVRDLRYCRKPIYLVSASSSDREFPSKYLRQHSARRLNCHADISFRGIHLINGGFTVNFDGEEDSAPRNKIQLTRALLILGVLQSIGEHRQGFVPLARSSEQKVASQYRKLMR